MSRTACHGILPLATLSNNYVTDRLSENVEQKLKTYTQIAKLEQI